MNDDNLSQLLDGVLNGHQEAFAPFIIILTTSTQAWLQEYLGYTEEDAEPKARNFVDDVMVVLLSEAERAALKAEGPIGWLKLRRRNHFFPHIEYSSNGTVAEAASSYMGPPLVQRFLQCVKKLGRTPRELLGALISEKPQQSLKKLADDQGLTVADVRIHLSAAVKAVSEFFKGSNKPR
jgi:hypothetical protein